MSDIAKILFPAFTGGLGAAVGNILFKKDSKLMRAAWTIGMGVGMAWVGYELIDGLGKLSESMSTTGMNMPEIQMIANPYLIGEYIKQGIESVKELAYNAPKIYT